MQGSDGSRVKGFWDGGRFGSGVGAGGDAGGYAAGAQVETWVGM